MLKPRIEKPSLFGSNTETEKTNLFGSNTETEDNTLKNRKLTYQKDKKYCNINPEEMFEVLKSITMFLKAVDESSMRKYWFDNVICKFSDIKPESFKDELFMEWDLFRDISASEEKSLYACKIFDEVVKQEYKFDDISSSDKYYVSKRANLLMYLDKILIYSNSPEFYSEWAENSIFSYGRKEFAKYVASEDNLYYKYLNEFKREILMYKSWGRLERKKYQGTVMDNIAELNGYDI